MGVINAGRWSEIETAADPAPRPKLPAGSYAERTHAPDDGRGLSLCGRRGVPLAGGGAVTCGNCRRRMEAAARRVARRDPPQDSDPMRAAGWKPRSGYSAGEWVQK